MERKRNSTRIKNINEEKKYLAKFKEKLGKGQMEIIRNQILSQLQYMVENNQLKNLNEDFRLYKQNQNNDQVINKLQICEKKAKFYGLKDIQKIISCAIGKRILNLEIQRKQKQNNDKKQKKKPIQESLRDYQIKNKNFSQLRKEKLKQNTLIVQPYKSGKGFLEHPSLFYRKIKQQQFQECMYSQVVKQVNKIFYSNMNSFQYIFKPKSIEIQTIGIIILFITLEILLICLFFVSFKNIEYLVILILTLLLILLMISGVKQFSYQCDKNKISQMETIKIKIRKYFQELNQKNQKQNKDFQWVIPEKFIYFSVKFNRNIFRK